MLKRRTPDSGAGDGDSKKPKLEYEDKQLAGNVGREVRLRANYYRVNFPTNIVVYQYHLEISPPIEERRKRGAILKNLAHMIGDFIISDHILFLLKSLPDGVDENVPLVSKNGESHDYNVRIHPIQDPNGATDSVYYCLNLLIKKLMRAKKLEQIGRAYFDPSKSFIVEDRGKIAFEIWPGFMTSLERLSSGLHMIAEVKSKVMRHESVYDAILRLHPAEANDLMRDKIVRTRYNNKTYKITSIDYGSKLSTTMFEDSKSGRTVSVLQYMRERYPSEMKQIDEQQPVIISSFEKRVTGFTRNFHLIPQLCLLSGLTDEMRANPFLMKTFKEHTLIAPKDRLDQLDALLRGFADPKLREAAQLRQWDIKISQDPISLVGRVLEPQQILMRNPNNGQAEAVDNANGDWGNFHRRGMHFHSQYKPNKEIQWAIIFPQAFPTVSSVVSTLQKVAHGAGVLLGEPCYFDLAGTGANNYQDALKQLPNDTDFVFCILPNSNKDRYEKIKQAYCFAKPVVSQCVTQRTLGKSLMSVCTKLIMQIVAKLGGSPWVLDFGLTKKRTMVVGVDVAHNPGKMSTVGMVASMNRNVSSFYSRVYPNAPGTQAIAQLGKFIQDACKAFKAGSANSEYPEGRYPTRIVIYRDGVGDGQLRTVLDAEHKQVEDMVEAIKVSEVIFVVVQKRINTRFFLENGRYISNAESGTVVDTVVTATKQKHAEMQTTFDFYLIGQSHMQGGKPAAGTMNPAHYWVRHPRIADPDSMTVDDLQVMTYRLCHMFYNWAGTVSAPALCKYAQVLASLVGKAIARDVNPGLYHKLYYL